MAVIMFTEEEVRAVLPAQRKNVAGEWVRDEDNVSTARAWEMFSGEGKYIDGDEAAQYVGDRLVDILTKGISFSPAAPLRDVNSLASILNETIYSELQKKYGTAFGFGDTEPRYHMTVMMRNLMVPLY